MRGRIKVALMATAALCMVPTAGSAATGQNLPGYRAALEAARNLRSGPPSRTTAATAPAGNISPNIEFVANIPEMQTAISIVFMGETMFVSTVHGVYSYDVSNPASPTLLGALPMYIWENEHMTADPKRHLLFISRDPRGFTTPATGGGDFPKGAIHVLDVSNPAVFKPVTVFTLDGGHTSTCINDCHFLWTGGPAAGTGSNLDGTIEGQDYSTWEGRPIFATDITDPASPKPCPKPLDLGADDGKTTYSHSVDVDAAGVAWVSGDRHVRGFWTSGLHYDPVTGTTHEATGCDPIPYAGGGTNEGALPLGAAMHNSSHNLGIAVNDRVGDVVAATEENTTTDCAQSGRFLTYDIGSSYQGQGWINTAKTHFRLRVLDSWTPKNQPGSTGCDSAHWFEDRGNGLIAIAFYSQGTRFLDIRDPYHIRQVAYYNPTGSGSSANGLEATNAWAAYWHNHDYVYVADFGRGVDILRYHEPSAATEAAVAPPQPAASPPARQSAPLPNTAAEPEALPAGLALAGGVLLLLLLLGAAWPYLLRRRN